MQIENPVHRKIRIRQQTHKRNIVLVYCNNKVRIEIVGRERGKQGRQLFFLQDKAYYSVGIHIVQIIHVYHIHIVVFAEIRCDIIHRKKLVIIGFF